MAIQATTNQNIKVIFDEEKDTTDEAVSKLTANLAGRFSQLDTTTWQKLVLHGVPAKLSMQDIRSDIENSRGQYRLMCDPLPLVRESPEDPPRETRSIILAFRSKDEIEQAIHLGFGIDGLLLYPRRWRPKPRTQHRTRTTNPPTGSTPVASTNDQ